MLGLRKVPGKRPSRGRLLVVKRRDTKVFRILTICMALLRNMSPHQYRATIKYSSIVWGNKLVKFNQAAAIIKSEINVCVLIQNDTLIFF